MKTSDVMNADPFCLHANDTVQYAATKFREKRIDAAPVIDETGKAVGLFTKTHLFHVVEGGHDGTGSVGQWMTAPVKTVPLHGAAEDLLKGKLHAAPVVDSQGRVVGLLTRDNVRDSLLMEFEKSHEKLKTVLESSYNAIIAIDAKGFVTNWNSAAERITGIDRTEANGRLLNDVLPMSELMTVLKNGRTKRGQKLQLGQTLAITNRAPIIKGGEIVGAVAVLQDISDLESIAAELKTTRELNKELDAIIDSVYEGLYITDGQANTLKINKAYTRMTGIKAEEVLGRNMKELVDNGYYSQSVSLLVLEKKKPVTIMHVIKGKKKYLITGNPVFNEKNEIFRVVTTVRDVSELNRLKQKLETAEKLSAKYHLEIQHLRSQQMKQTEFIERSEKMKDVLNVAYQAAQGNATVLILGETGVGKELVGRYIHKNSPRNQAPFINVNCAAIPENLLESELFGYEKGAFTDATTSKPGMFELADTGTIFLDEIGDLAFGLQGKLLRVLQEKEVTRIGGTKHRRLDIRIIAATNRDLGKLVKEGTFREDLFYRLNVIPILIPPLRVRKEEIPYLANHFLAILNKQYGRSKSMRDRDMEILMQYTWPGNIRELRNIIERWIVIDNEDLVSLVHLENEGMPASFQQADKAVRLRDAVSEIEKRLLTQALEKGSTRKAARQLGISQPSLLRRARKYGIETG
ncbi:MAG: PAS domain S-box protein [Desulfobacteraceae bacterium]|nr:MAG: PAS domain S-box protein [Desulfobacteraceae bacterium]